MSKHKLLSLYGLEWSPFGPQLPVEAIRITGQIDRFVWRVEQLATDGGFAMITGDLGTAKSVIMRLLESRLSDIRDVALCPLTRPQSGIGDFYRELGEAFGAPISASNRWGGFKLLREKWKAKLESSLRRPLVLAGEAQQMQPAVLSELRLLASDHFDSNSLLTVVLAGDGRLTDMLRHDELIPLGSRIRTRLVLDPMPADEIVSAIEHAITQAGNAHLMTKPLMQTIAEQAVGNWRAAMNVAQELLLAAAVEERSELDEQLFFDVFGGATKPRRRPRRGKAS